MSTKEQAYKLAGEMRSRALNAAEKLNVGAMGRIDFESDLTGKHVVLRVRFHYAEE